MNARLKLITSPTVEPVTLEQALVQCHADAGIEDSWFTSRIKAGRELAENFQRRAYLDQEWEMTFDSTPDFPLLIPRAPLISVDSIKVYDTDNAESVCDLDDFFIDTDTEPGQVLLNSGSSWPAVQTREMSAVKIRFTAGYGSSADDVPEYVKDAILIYVSHHWNNRGVEAELPDAFYNTLRPQRLYL